MSPEPSDIGALFGFVGTPPAARQAHKDAFLEAVKAQLGRLFGPNAATPKALYFQDWTFEAETATPLDQKPLMAHPAYGPVPALTGVWGGALLFGSTEMAATYGGYLEGALEAAENTAKQLLTP